MPDNEGQLTLPIYIRAKSQTARCRCGKPLYYPPDSEVVLAWIAAPIVSVINYIQEKWWNP